MKRLLCIVGGMNIGGAETFLMKVYRVLDRTKYQMDFAVAIEGEGAYDKEILSLGGKIFHITPKSKGLLKNFSDIKRLVKEEGYSSVLRTSQHSLSALELLAAKKGGARVRVFRSSNTNAAAGKIGSLTHSFFRFMPKKFANVRLAPSCLAAEFMFGKNSVKKGKATVLPNGVDLDVYRYDETGREEIRKEFDIASDALVVGHIGRFNYQKNHAFLLKVFCEILKKRKDTILLLVGKGELETQIKNEIKILGIENKVVFTGVRSDVPRLLSAMDVFVFPSFYEGMPNTVIEAQATGLPCVISDTITDEADITGLVKYVSLDIPASAWADDAIKHASRSEERKDTHEDFARSGYSIKGVVDKFCELCFCDRF